MSEKEKCQDILNTIVAEAAKHEITPEKATYLCLRIKATEDALKRNIEEIQELRAALEKHQEIGVEVLATLARIAPEQNVTKKLRSLLKNPKDLTGRNFSAT